MINAKLNKEKSFFNEQIDERIKHGFVPDLRNLKKVNWFYNNPWRDPEFVKIQILPSVNFVLKIAKERGGIVIELGCGCGYLTLELARCGLDVTGVDISSNSIKIANRYARKNKYIKNFGSLTYICDDIATIDLGKDIFDTVIFFRTLHHVRKLDPLLSKVNQALKKSGNLIISEPIRDNFTRKSAEFAAILRAILPTWIPYEQKIRGVSNSKSWHSYVNKIYDEYKYKGDHKQSSCDNATSSGNKMINAIENNFEIKRIEYSDAFIDNLIGGLRGRYKYELAHFLKFIDNELIRKNILPHTSINLHAIKKH